METNENMSLVDLLMRPELPDVQRELPTKDVEVIRLSGIVGQPVVLHLQGLPYGRVQELKRTAEREVQILVSGCPQLRDPQLLARWNAPTYAEAARRMLLPGEIDELSLEIERLSGYRMNTIREVKNA